MRAEQKPDTKVEQGALVRYCGHNGAFMADLYFIAGAVTIRANGPIERVLMRGDEKARAAKYWMQDYPTPGFWRPELGVFVVPAKQLKEQRIHDHTS